MTRLRNTEPSSNTSSSAFSITLRSALPRLEDRAERGEGAEGAEKEPPTVRLDATWREERYDPLDRCCTDEREYEKPFGPSSNSVTVTVPVACSTRRRTMSCRRRRMQVDAVRKRSGQQSEEVWRVESRVAGGNRWPRGTTARGLPTALSEMDEGYRSPVRAAFARLVQRGQGSTPNSTKEECCANVLCSVSMSSHCRRRRVMPHNVHRRGWQNEEQWRPAGVTLT